MMIKAYKVCCGTAKSHSFVYCKTEAQAKAELFRQENEKKSGNSFYDRGEIWIEQIEAQACDLCGECSEAGRYCLKCEKIIDDAREQQNEMRKARERAGEIYG